ncbi:MAG: LemA family protein [Bacilli bacterium]|nr:LemA family protein [Bacilli bacterium]
METGTIILIVVIAMVVLLVFWYFKTYNALIELRNRKDDQFSQIDVQLKRRSDLIPNLVETVKGYAKHESDTLEEVIRARNEYNTARTNEDKMKASGEITQALNKLFALSEAYPDLKANTNFMSLQNDLKETEDKISVARQFYNDTVLTYNNKVETVPSNIVANIGGFKKSEFFQIDEASKEAPKVKF